MPSDGLFWSPESSPRLRDDRRLRAGFSGRSACTGAFSPFAAVPATASSCSASPSLALLASVSVACWLELRVATAPSVSPTLPSSAGLSEPFEDFVPCGASTGPPCLASMAAMMSFLRIRPVPVIPRLDANRCSSVSFNADSPVPPERRLDRVDAFVSAEEAGSPASAPDTTDFCCALTAVSVWSSVVSLTKGPSQGAGCGRHHLSNGRPGGANRRGPGRACPMWYQEPWSLPNRGGLWARPDIGAMSSIVLPVNRPPALTERESGLGGVGAATGAPRTRHSGNRAQRSHGEHH